MIVEVNSKGSSNPDKQLKMTINLLTEEARIISSKLDQIGSYLMSIDRSVFGYNDRIYNLESRVEELERELLEVDD